MKREVLHQNRAFANAACHAAVAAVAAVAAAATAATAATAIWSLVACLSTGNDAQAHWHAAAVADLEALLNPRARHDLVVAIYPGVA